MGAVLYITQGQTINAGLNFMAIRVVEIAAFLRIVFRAELPTGQFTRVDKWLVTVLFSNFAVDSLRSGAIQSYSLGLFVDGTLVFFAFRAFIRTPQEYISFLRGVCLLLVPFAAAMSVESIAGRNLFAYMGGVPETPAYRDGYFRAQGSFRHAITAGTLGASFAPLYTSLLLKRPYPGWAVAGLGACVVIVLASHSSGPLLASITGLCGWLCWSFRHRMTLVRWGILSGVVLLQLVMTSPVWFIFSRISTVVGGDGWHRSKLIDQFVKHIDEWWLIGMPLEDTWDWAATQMPWGGVDVTNYYVALGISGGGISLLLFIVLLVSCFKRIGRALQMAREWSAESPGSEAILWGLGVCITVHIVNLTAVTYFDQFYAIWYSQLAAAVAVSHYFVRHDSVAGIKTVNAVRDAVMVR